MATRMQQRRGTAAQWVSTNNGDGPILEAGEIGFESDTGKFKIGDGVNHWVDLDYFLDESDIAGVTGDYVLANSLGQANGVATLDADAKLTASQLPGIEELAQDAVDMALVAGTGISKTYNDNANTITIAVDTTVIATKAELAEVSQDSINDALVAGTGITKSYDDNANTITVSVDTSTIQARVANVSDTEIGYLANVTSDIQTQLNSKASATDLSNHESDTSNVHGIADTSLLATTSGSQTLTNKTVDLANNTITGTIAQFNTALSDADFATLAGSETLSNKTISNSTLGNTVVLGANLDAATFTVTNLGTPTNTSDAATKAYVDAVAEGLHIHPSAVAATTTNISISTDLEPGDVIDGVTLAEGNRVLVKNQTNAAQNGIYVVQASGAALRASDFNEPAEVDGGDFIFVTGGTVNDNTGWVQTTENVVTVGTDPIIFTQFAGAGTYTAGNGLSLNGTEFSINTTITADLSSSQVLLNKTVDLANNTVTGTVAEFNTALSDANFVTTTDTGTVTSTMIADGTIVNGDISASAAIDQSKIANLTTDLGNKQDKVSGVSDTEIGYLDGVTSNVQAQIDGKISASSTDTLLNKTLNLANNTVSGTIAQFNTALSDADFATLAGSETLTNKTINSALVSTPVLFAPEERWNIRSGSLFQTINFDVLSGGIVYWTTAASGNWTLNVRGDGSNTLNNILAINDSITVVFFATNGATPYYQTDLQIDGSSVTPKWQNGTAPSAGNANSIDIYSYTIVKTANATFTVFGSQTKFA